MRLRRFLPLVAENATTLSEIMASLSIPRVPRVPPLLPVEEEESSREVYARRKPAKKLFVITSASSFNVSHIAICETAESSFVLR